MAEHKSTILVVDDADDNHQLLDYLLCDDYEVYHAKSGKQCLQEVNEADDADLILLDVNMPEIDGYQVCNSLKNNPKTALIPIIFVSALDSLDDRLRGYQAGGDEYITKPIEGSILVEKIKHTLKEKQVNCQLRTDVRVQEDKAEFAMGTAMEALTMNAEYGQILRYMQQAASCNNYTDLITALFSTTTSFALDCCAMIRSPSVSHLFGCRGDTLEAKVLRDYKSADKVFSFGGRTIVNTQRIILLVKNMPLDEPEKCGRLKDHLVMITDSTNKRLEHLEVNHQSDLKRTASVKQLIETCENGLALVENRIDDHEEDTRRIMQKLLDNLEEKLFSLALDEDQEKSLVALADQAGKELETLGGFQQEIHQSLHNITKGLHDLGD